MGAMLFMGFVLVVSFLRPWRKPDSEKLSQPDSKKLDPQNEVGEHGKLDPTSEVGEHGKLDTSEVGGLGKLDHREDEVLAPAEAQGGSPEVSEATSLPFPPPPAGKDLLDLPELELDVGKSHVSKLRDSGRAEVRPPEPEQEPPLLQLPGQPSAESNSFVAAAEKKTEQSNDKVTAAGQELMHDLEALFNSLGKGQADFIRAELDRLFEEWTNRQLAARTDADVATVALLNGLADVAREALIGHSSGTQAIEVDFSLLKPSLEDAIRQRMTHLEPGSRSKLAEDTAESTAEDTVEDIAEDTDDLDEIWNNRSFAEQLDAQTAALEVTDGAESGPWCPADQTALQLAGEDLLWNLQVLLETTSFGDDCKAEVDSFFDWWQGRQDCRSEDVHCMVALLEIAQSICLDQAGRHNLGFTHLKAKIVTAWRKNLPCNRAPHNDSFSLQLGLARPRHASRLRRSSFVLSDLMDSPMNSRSAIGSSRAHRIH